MIIFIHVSSFLLCLQVRSLNAQLAETSDERSRVEDRLNTLQKSMTEVEEDKRGLGMCVKTTRLWHYHQDGDKG